MFDRFRRLLAYLLAALVFAQPALAGSPEQRAAILSASAIQIPAALGWPISTYPVTITKSGAAYTASINARALVSAPFSAGATEYWVAQTGNNGNSGLTPALAKKGINSAITAGNATAGPYRINVLAGTYQRPDSINGSSGVVMPTQPVAIIGYGGRVIQGSFGDLTYTLVDAPTNTYSAPRSTVARVVDLSMLNAYGNYPDLTQVADQATVQATPNSWALVANTTLYVHRGDGAAPTNTNTRVYLNTASGYFDSTTKDVYLENIDAEGGQQGAFAFVSGTRNVAIVNSSAKYSGTNANFYTGIHFSDINGLMLMSGVIAAANASDGINGDNAGGLPSYVLTINCQGFDNGRYTSTSNNGRSMHNTVIGIDVAGRYYANINGSDYHNINTTKDFAVGTIVNASDTVESPTTHAAFKASNTSTLWLNGVTAQSSAMALYAQGGTIYYRPNIQILSGTQVSDTGGQILPY